MTNKKSRSQLGYWQRHVEAWRTSGLSRRAYCQQNGQTYHRMTYWERKLRPRPIPALIPVRVAPAESSSVRLILPNGLAIQCEAGTDAVWIASVVREIAR